MRVDVKLQGLNFDTLVVQMKPDSNFGFSFTGIEMRKEVCEQESLLLETCIAPIP